jgi:hypothetical protein
LYLGPFRYLYKNARSTSSPSRWRRSDGLHREAQSRFNAALQARLAELPPGEPVLMEVVSWLQDRGAEFLTPPAGELLTPPHATADDVRAAADGEEFCRYWIYSHHIYSKVKRRTLQELAEQFRLTGFCLPGKPGIICVEVRYLLSVLYLLFFPSKPARFFASLADLWIGFVLMPIRNRATPTMYFDSVLHNYAVPTGSGSRTRIVRSLW